MSSVADTTYDPSRAVSAPKRSAQWRKLLVAYSFIAPNFLGFTIFTLGPILFSFALAFLHWDGSNPITFAGLDNFWRLFSDSAFIAALWNTILYTVLSVPLTLVCALGLALLLNQKIPGRNFLRTAMFFPYVASLVAVAVVWNMLFNPEMGPVNMVLYTLGVDPRHLPRWAADKNWAMITVVLFGAWKSMGYYMVIYLAALGTVPKDLHEAAQVDGAGWWRRLFSVTLPALRPTMVLVAVLSSVSAFRVFSEVYLLAGQAGGPGGADTTLVMLIQQVGTGLTGDLGYSSALSVVLFVLTLGLLLATNRLNRQEDL